MPLPGAGVANERSACAGGAPLQAGLGSYCLTIGAWDGDGAGYIITSSNHGLLAADELAWTPKAAAAARAALPRRRRPHPCWGSNSPAVAPPSVALRLHTHPR